jgi:hypothetical protein
MNDKTAAGIKPFADFYSELQPADHAQLNALASTRTRSNDAFETQRKHLLGSTS